MMRRHFGWLLLLGGLAVAPGPALAQSTPRTVGTLPIAEASLRAQAFVDRMVRIVARVGKDSTGVYGYGFVVGERTTAQGQPGYLVVTADHLVRDPAKPTAQFDPPQVTFYADLAHTTPAEILSVHLAPAQGDLAVLVVPKPPGPPPQPVMMGDTQSLLPGMAAWQLGLPGVWILPQANARFALREPTGWLNFQGLDASPATSGGAVLTELGLVGMVVGRTSPDAPVRVLPVELIVNKFREWALAWNIFTGGASTPTTTTGTPAVPGTGTLATNAPSPQSGQADRPTNVPGNELGAITIVNLLPSELATRGSWTPPGARVSPWLRSGAVLWGAPRKDANRVGALPAGYLLPVDLWSGGAYDIQNRIDNGAWFLLGRTGQQSMGYVAGTDVVEVWPPMKPGTPQAGKVVREFPMTGGKAILRDAGNHYEMTLSLTCDLAVCDSLLIFTPIPPSPGAVVPTFQVPNISGNWQQNDTAEVNVSLPRSLVQTKGAQLVTCFGLLSGCNQQRLPIGG